MHEHQAGRLPRPYAATDQAWDDLQVILNESLLAIPEKYRAALVVCYWEGKTHEQAARQIGCPLGTLQSRVIRGRNALQRQFKRRGIILSLEALVATLIGAGVQASVPGRLLKHTLRSALAISTGKAANTLVSASVAGLLEEGMTTLLAANTKIAYGLLVLMGLMIAGAGVLAHQIGIPSELQEKSVTSSELAPSRSEQERVANEQPLARTDRYGDPLPQGAIARLGTVRLRQGGSIYQLSFSPDSKTLAAASTDGFNSVYVWDTDTGKQLRRFSQRGGKEDIAAGQAAAFSPDGTRLAVGGYRAVYLWDARTGQPVAKYPVRSDPGPSTWVSFVAFSPNGKFLAALGSEADNNLCLFDLSTGKELHHVDAPKNYARSSFTFSPDSTTYAYATRKDTSVKIFDSTTGKERSQLVGHGESIRAIAFSPDGAALASSADDGFIRLWELAAGKELRRIKHDTQILKLAFSPDGQQLVGGGFNLRRWEVASGNELPPFEWNQRGELVEFFAFSPDGKRLAVSCDGSKELFLWDTATGKRVCQFDGHRGGVTTLAFSPDGSALASGGLERNSIPGNAIRLWEPTTGKEIRRIGERLGQVHSLTFAPNQPVLIAADEDRTIHFWNWKTGNDVQKLKGHKSFVWSIAISEDGKILASRDTKNNIILWDAASGKELRRFPGLQDYNAAMILSPDGRLIAQGGPERNVVAVWDVATRKELSHSIQSNGHGVQALAFSADSKTLAVNDRGGTISIWDAQTGKSVQRLAGHESWIGFIAYSRDGKSLASGGGDQTIRVWELATGMERCKFSGAQESILSGAISSDGRFIASGSEDTTILVWDVDTGIEQNPRGPGDITAAQFDRLWSDLADKDAARAFRAMRVMVSTWRQCLPFLKQRLRPVIVPETDRLAKLVAALDSNDFAIREKASSDLESLAELAEPVLRQAVAGQPTPELRRRAEKLLEQLEPSHSLPQLRTLRSLEVLEAIGTKEAAEFLQTLSQGASEARITQEAKASLKRLAKQAAAKKSAIRSSSLMNK